MIEAPLLQKIYLFKNLDENETELVRSLLSEEKYEDGERIVEEGKPGESLYIIWSGKVRVCRNFDTENFVLTELGPYDFFGEMSLIDDFATSATVIATGKTRLLRMRRDGFKKLVSQNTQLSSKLWESLAHNLTTRIRKTDELVQMYYGLSKALCENPQFRELYTAWNFNTRKSLQ